METGFFQRGFFFDKLFRKKKQINNARTSKNLKCVLKICKNILNLMKSLIKALIEYSLRRTTIIVYFVSHAVKVSSVP